jgi:Icc-related predicted phosphoesterase
MKLVSFVDVHDQFAKVADVLRKVTPVDVAIIAGDITTGGTPADVERAISLWRPVAPQFLAVAGNMDSPQIDQTLERLGVSINGCCQRIGSVAFFGCSAAPVSIGTPYEIPESEIAARIERGFEQAKGASRLVFVPHAPPFGTLDKTWTGVRAGSRAVREFIERAQPALVLCGHIHEARGQARIGQSLVVNCGPAAKGHYAVVDLGEQDCRVELERLT